MTSHWRQNYSLSQLLLVVVMVANVCGVVVALRTIRREMTTVVDARFSSDGRTLVAILGDNRRVTCDAATGKLIDSAPANWPQRFGWQSHQLAADGNTWAAVPMDGHVEFGRFQPATRYYAEVPPATPRGALGPAAALGPGKQVSLSDNGAVFAGAYQDSRPPYQSRVAVWDVASGKPLRTLKVQGLQLCSLCLAPDGKTLAIEKTFNAPGCTRGIEFWDIASGRKLGATLPVDFETIDGMVWAADDTLVWISRMRTPHPRVRSLRRSGGQQRQTELDLGDAPGFEGGDRLFVSADGRTVAVSELWFKAQFLDAATLRPLGKPFSLGDPQHCDMCTPLALSTDGKELATANSCLGTPLLRMFDRQGKVRRDLLLYEKHGWIVDTTIWGNVVLFAVCFGLVAAISHTFRRRSRQYSPWELRQLNSAEERLP